MLRSKSRVVFTPQNGASVVSEDLIQVPGLHSKVGMDDGYDTSKEGVRMQSMRTQYSVTEHGC